MNQDKIKEGVRLILEGIGEDINREGLLETPDRIARMYEELAAGYTDDAAVHLKKRFHVDNNDMVMEKDIHFYSFCEHHMLPLLRKRGHRLHSQRGSGGPEQDCQDCGGVRKTVPASGETDRPDRGCLYGGTEAKGRDGAGPGRAYVHDHARHQKIREPEPYL